jgi:hypothetical protein
MNQATLRMALAAACLAAVAGCSSTSGESGGGKLTNYLLYGSATVPPSRAEALVEAPCPAVDVIEGGAAMRVGGTQISLGDLARECTVNQDKSLSVVLLGPGGTGGRFTAPIRINIKVGDRVIASRSRIVAVAIPPGEAQGFFNIVETGFVVPNQYAEYYEIEVGLAGGGRAATPARRAAR